MHVLDGAQIPCEGAWLGERTCPSMPDDSLPWAAQNGWTDRFAVWVVDSGAGWVERSINSIAFARCARQYVLFGGNIGAPGEYDWTVRLRRRCGFMWNYFDHLLLIITSMHCVSSSWNWIFLIKFSFKSRPGLNFGQLTSNLNYVWRCSLKLKPTRKIATQYITVCRHSIYHATHTSCIRSSRGSVLLGDQIAQTALPFKNRASNLSNRCKVVVTQ